MLLALKPFSAFVAFASLAIFILLPRTLHLKCTTHLAFMGAPHNMVQQPAMRDFQQHQHQPWQQKWRSETSILPSCQGRRVYIYPLPHKFNKHLLHQCGNKITSWLNFCHHISHHGLGKPLINEVHASSSSLPERQWKPSEHVSSPESTENLSTFHLSTEWHHTDAYTLELIFHHRLLHYPCLTGDPDQADAFFLPYYAGLDALKYLYNIHHKPKSRHGSDLVSWIQQDAIAKEKWARYRGHDHFLVMGRTPWDFGSHGSGAWGTGMLQIQQYKNMTLLLIEKQPWMQNQQAIPYPTSFHPRSSSSLRAWIHRVRTEERSTLFAFAGSIRPAMMKHSIRGILLEQCSSLRKCKLVDCKALRCGHNPQPIVHAFLHSHFCLQPRGDTPTRRSLFDSLIAGCIPVLFHNDTAYTQYEWHLPVGDDEHDNWSVYVDEEDIRRGADVEKILMTYSEAKIRQMRENVVAMIPRLLYTGVSESMPLLEHPQDAFDVTVEQVLQRVGTYKMAQTQS